MDGPVRQPGREPLDPGAWPQFTDAELDELGPFGVERRVTPGQVLFRAGEASFDLFAVVAGGCWSSAKPSSAV